ncbi:MAG: FHA domain-containing protein, partial [Chloroflexi bacterium]
PATPVYTPPPTPVYTPPTAPTPVYTPPPTPVYTPSPTVEPYVAPTVAAPQLPATPPEPVYVPPVTQTPPVAPQPKVTLVPGSQTSKPSITPPPPPRPQKVYYTPSNQAQPTPTVEQGQPTTEQATPLDSTLTAPIQQAVTHSITAKPSAQLASDRNVPWGRLTFDNGTQVQLTGERAVVGRYDHDLGGIRPEVDLGQMEGADTISRVHAAIEHIGSTYVLTDLNSTNATRLNGKRLEPDKATPLNDGDKLTFGKISSTFNKL